MKRRSPTVPDEKTYHRVGRDHGRRRQTDGAAVQTRKLIEVETRVVVAELCEAAEMRVASIARDLRELRAELEITPRLNGSTPPPLVRQRDGEIHQLVLRQAGLESDLEDVVRSFGLAKARIEANADRCQAAYFAARFDASACPVPEDIEPIRIELGLDLRGLRQGSQ